MKMLIIIILYFVVFIFTNVFILVFISLCISTFCIYLFILLLISLNISTFIFLFLYRLFFLLWHSFDSITTGFTACPNFMTGGQDTWGNIDSLHCTLTQFCYHPRWIILCVYLLFLPCCLPKGRKHLVELFDSKIIHHLLNTRQSGYSSNKKLRRQSKLFWLWDKLCPGKWERSFREPCWTALSSGASPYQRKQYAQPTSSLKFSN